jgi:small subunit ribosomal protein S1
LILDLGVRGFLPASLVDIRRVQDLDEFMGQELRTKVIELNRSRNNVVLSRRAVLEDERKEMRQAILDRLNPGDVVEGQISNIVDFGAFVDLDGMDGLIHISELSWSHVNHPSEVLEIGQTVKVKVLDIDRERQRISLGLKQTQSDPWQQVLEQHKEGDVVEGKVTKVVTFGAFVDLDGMDGLIHISELSWSHVNHPSEVLEIGQTVKVKVLDIDRERQRISLGLKQTQSDPWQQVLEQHKEGDVVEGKVTKVVTFGAFVEILPGVEGLVHISELAQHHVENPREVVSQGDTVPVLILEVDAERRRLSLSLKRVDADRRAESEGPIEGTPHLDLSEDVFSDSASAPLAPELDAPPAAAAEEVVEREAVATGDEVDPAAADEAPAVADEAHAPADEASAPVEPVSDEH